MSSPSTEKAVLADEPTPEGPGRIVEIPGSAPSGHHAPIFDRAYRFTKSDELMQVGLYPYFRTIESAQDTEVIIDGKKMLMLGSNSYMGLTNDPRIKEAINKAVSVYGSGCAGSRFLNGTLDIHIELEEQIADYIGTEAALAFTTGFQANLGVISAMIGKDDHVFIDRSDHASIVDGCRLGFGKIHKFRHNDLSSLERALRLHDATGKLIIVDGIYSMEGDIAQLPEIIQLAKRYRAGVLVDDAHAVGVIGHEGSGTASHFDLVDDVDLIVGTFSKSLASIGGYVAGSKEIISYLKHHARSLIFSASMAPACVAAASKAIEIIRSEPERRDRLWENTRFLLDGLKSLGFDTGVSESPIIPILVGDLMSCFRFWRALHDAGIFVNPVVPPATPPGQCLIRLSVMATHTQDQLSYALETLERIGREQGVIGVLRH